jgi:hypothetical protein
MHPHPESDIQPFVPPMTMPPMLGKDHHFFLLEVEVEEEEEEREGEMTSGNGGREWRRRGRKR